MIDSVNYWLLQPQIWLILGIILIIAEVLIGAAYFLLALGVACLLFALTMFLQEMGLFLLIEDWIDVSFSYGVLALASVATLKLFVEKGAKSDDINKY